MTFNASRASVSTVLATAFFVVVTIALGALATNVIITMRDSANIVDNERSVDAAHAALSSAKAKLASITRDNAQWDDANDAAYNGTLAEWAIENWGNVSENYELYDGVIVLSPDGEVVMSARHGKPAPFDATKVPEFLPQARAAAQNPGRTFVNFAHSRFGAILVSSQAIQPHSRDGDDRPHAVVAFIKDLDAAELRDIEQHHMLNELELHFGEDDHSDGKLSVPLNDYLGNTVGHLAWTGLTPGTRVFAEVRGQVNAAICLLIVFMVAVIYAGSREARRMRRLARQARHDATHDALSGLHNRAGLFEAVSQELSAGRPHTLHLLGLDGFKAINDTWGHQIGDKLITAVSAALKNCHMEVLHAARVGGDEFALIQRGTTPPAEFAEAIRGVFDSVFEFDGRTIEVGASVGYAGSDDLTDPFELLRRANLALHRAKDDGKGRAVAYQAELDVERERLVDLEEDLRNALQKGGVTVAYQPLVSAATGEMTGVEALARWITERGPVSPEIFIALAERAGLIDKLGEHVLRKSIQSASVWPDLKIAVNVSPIQLCNPSFAASVGRILEEERFDPTRLTLEITEGVLMSNPDQAKRAIDELHRIGVRFSLDDFGCGFASIGTLRQFRFDRMKIDRSLVWAADTEGSGREVLKATISLATALSIPVTAEGIETEEQVEVLRAAGCDQFQGYLIGRPMPADEITRLICNKAA